MIKYNSIYDEIEAMTNPANQKILVVDDESTIREVVRRYLEKEGFQVIEAADGYEAFDSATFDNPDLIILDLMLPGIDGLTITRQLRTKSKKQIPIIMLTAKGETTDRIRGLDFGADDYVSKPFSPRELISRVHAVLRRATGYVDINKEEQIKFGEFLIDPAARTVNIGGKSVNLSLKEYDLLLFLTQNPAQVFTRSQLLKRVWGYDDLGDASTVTVHIRRLREKIEQDPSKPQYLLTVWGVGYKFETGE